MQTCFTSVPGSEIGMHEAGFDQLFLVVSGEAGRPFRSTPSS